MLRTFFYDHPLKLFPTTTTFGEIFLNHVVASFFYLYNGISTVS